MAVGREMSSIIINTEKAWSRGGRGGRGGGGKEQLSPGGE